ncbi:MAG: AMP-dependent synthetase, partial [Brooklawnia sp.]
MVSRIRTCAPSEVAELLPGALAGEYVLAPVPDRTAQQALRVDEPLEAADVAVVVTSSGSTGTPKGVL